MFKFSPHIAVQVKNYPEAVLFYSSVLGMKPEKEDENETCFEKDGIRFYIENSDECKTFFEFQVDDILEAKRLLLENGCTITKEYDEKSVMIEDPFGMKFHVWEENSGV
jgi:predicted enzyme related to lactoylglutathione lyase